MIMTVPANNTVTCMTLDFPVMLFVYPIDWLVGLDGWLIHHA